MHYDFIEVGTSDFDTLCQTCSDDQYGMSVEPVTECIRNLPNKSNVVKVNAALVTNEYRASNEIIEIFYIDEKTIERENLGRWIRGCNKINEPHEMHLAYVDDPSKWFAEGPSKSRNLVDEGLVTKDAIRCITWNDLFSDFDVTSVGYVKIDAEGADADIVMGLMKECVHRNNVNLFPKTIRFENSSVGMHERIKEAIAVLEKNNYYVIADPDCPYDSVATLIIPESNK